MVFSCNVGYTSTSIGMWIYQNGCLQRYSPDLLTPYKPSRCNLDYSSSSRWFGQRQRQEHHHSTCVWITATLRCPAKYQILSRFLEKSQGIPTLTAHTHTLKVWPLPTIVGPFGQSSLAAKAAVDPRRQVPTFNRQHPPTCLVSRIICLRQVLHNIFASQFVMPRRWWTG